MEEYIDSSKFIYTEMNLSFATCMAERLRVRKRTNPQDGQSGTNAKKQKDDVFTMTKDSQIGKMNSLDLEKCGSFQTTSDDLTRVRSYVSGVRRSPMPSSVECSQHERILRVNPRKTIHFMVQKLGGKDKSYIHNENGSDSLSERERDDKKKMSADKSDLLGNKYGSEEGLHNDGRKRRWLNIGVSSRNTLDSMGGHKKESTDDKSTKRVVSKKSGVHSHKNKYVTMSSLYRAYCEREALDVKMKNRSSVNAKRSDMIGRTGKVCVVTKESSTVGSSSSTSSVSVVSDGSSASIDDVDESELDRSNVRDFDDRVGGDKYVGRKVDCLRRGKGRRSYVLIGSKARPPRRCKSVNSEKGRNSVPLLDKMTTIGKGMTNKKARHSQSTRTGYTNSKNMNGNGQDMHNSTNAVKNTENVNQKNGHNKQTINADGTSQKKVNDNESNDDSWSDVEDYSYVDDDDDNDGTEEARVTRSGVWRREGDDGDGVEANAASSGVRESEEVTAITNTVPNTRVGVLIWGKFGSHNWWPGMIITAEMVHMTTSRFGYSWVFWFGDHKVSEICDSKTMSFVDNYTEMYGKIRPKGKLWKSGVLEAVQMCATRMGSTVQRSSDELLDWAYGDFTGYHLTTSPPNTENVTIPPEIQRHLNSVGDKILAARRQNSDTPVTTTQDNIERETTLESIRNSELDIRDVCLACLDVNDPVICSHPFFEGGLCQHCKDQMVSTMYAVGEDGSGAFCSVCASGGNMFVCSSLSCQRVYCCQCVEDFVGRDARIQIEETDPWNCFLCDAQQPCGLLNVQPDWQLNIVNLFNISSQHMQPLDRSKLRNSPLRVLSLFDGIATGRIVLDKLGLKVDSYYASEIDPEAIRVSNVNLGDRIIQIGDIRQINATKIREICPIDLVIGGSPCNDISCVNPARKGLYDFEGSGVLFFEFHRILQLVRDCSHGNHVLWLFENVAFMPHTIRQTITRFLQCEPALWDAKFFSAQNRPRLFWGNIPGIYSTPDVYLSEPYHSLEEMLTPNCNRHARVQKLRTVTTKSNSLKQGKHDNVFPVSMGGVNDVVWIQELERIFGFPEHFTDVSNLSTGKRQKLLGKAWSVMVVEHILSPLTHFFPSHSLDDSHSRGD